jgi:ABC-type antimicrobial peptide transport system permease subunit
MQVIGVAGHIRNETPEADSRPQIYFHQLQRTQDRAALVVRTLGDPARFTDAVIRQIHAENPEQPVYDVRTMREWTSRALASRNLTTAVIPLFGAAALALACLGIYGVVAYTANLRTREFGIRIALGAEPAAMRRAVVAHGGKLTAAGLGLGLLLTWPASSFIRSFLFGVTPGDPATLIAVPAILLLVAFAASWSPALRASRTDPMQCLREQE